MSKILSFSDTSEQWTFHNSDKKPKSFDIIHTKLDDGPNINSYMSGVIISSYILKYFNNSEELRNMYSDKAVSIYADIICETIKSILSTLKEGKCFPLYYRDYKLKPNSIPKLESLLKLIRISNLEIRLSKLQEAYNVNK